MDKNRRQVVFGLAGMALAGLAGAAPKLALSRPSELKLPRIGMGTWLTFNTPPLTGARKQRVEVLRTFFDAGGRLIDSSPMYGFAESTVGHCLAALDNDQHLFAATKVWTPTRLAGITQMNASIRLWGVDQMDLMQIHNMVDWTSHLPTLREWRDEGRIRFIGITTSHGRRHERMLDVIATEPDFDTVQFTYNLEDREAERRLLPAAAEHGKKVIINRPFKRGALFDRIRGHKLPPWAAESGCRNWAQYFLKFVISHPAVSCAIPATSRVDHMRQNMGALTGPMPDRRMRQRMAEHFDKL